MSTLREILAECRVDGLAKAAVRDSRVADDGIQKIAKGKKALGLWGRLKGVVGINAEKMKLLSLAERAKLQALKGVLQGGPKAEAFAHFGKNVSALEKAIAPPGLTKQKVIGGLAGAAALGAGASELHDQLVLRRNLREIENDPEIPKNLRPRAREMFGVLKRYAPSLAKDPTVAKDFTRNMIRHQSIDHATVKDIIHAEKESIEAGGKAQLLQKGMSVAKVMGV